MASKRILKKDINKIANQLFIASLAQGVDRQVICNSVNNVIRLAVRANHAEPGNVKGFYKKLIEDLNKEIKIVSDELEKAAKA